MPVQKLNPIVVILDVLRSQLGFTPGDVVRVFGPGAESFGVLEHIAFTEFGLRYKIKDDTEGAIWVNCEIVKQMDRSISSLDEVSL